MEKIHDTSKSMNIPSVLGIYRGSNLVTKCEKLS